MDEGECGYSGVFSDISIDDVVPSFSYWYYLQVVLCDVAYY